MSLPESDTLCTRRCLDDPGKWGNYARDHNLRLSDLAQAFIDSDPADFPGLTPPAPQRHSQ